MENIRPETGWACVCPPVRGRTAWVAGFSFKSSRVDSQAQIGRYEKHEGESDRQGWQRAYRKGWRCVRASVSVDQ